MQGLEQFWEPLECHYGKFIPERTLCSWSSFWATASTLPWDERRQMDFYSTYPVSLCASHSANQIHCAFLQPSMKWNTHLFFRLPGSLGMHFFLCATRGCCGTCSADNPSGYFSSSVLPAPAPPRLVLSCIGLERIKAGSSQLTNRLVFSWLILHNFMLFVYISGKGSVRIETAN